MADAGSFAITLGRHRAAAVVILGMLSIQILLIVPQLIIADHSMEAAIKPVYQPVPVPMFVFAKLGSLLISMEKVAQLSITVRLATVDVRRSVFFRVLALIFVLAILVIHLM